MKRIQVGDIVMYFGEKAKVRELHGDHARISINRNMAGSVLNVRTSDLQRLGQGLAEARSSAK